MPKIIGPTRVKRIPLTRGYYALVDAMDHDRVNAYKWCIFLRKNGSVVAARRTVRDSRGQYTRLLHHEILDVYPSEISPKVVDHINRNPLDNRKVNLRLVTSQENCYNCKRSDASRGYSFNKRVGKWQVYTRIPCKPYVYLGYFPTEQEAIARVKEYQLANN